MGFKEEEQYYGLETEFFQMTCGGGGNSSSNSSSNTPDTLREVLSSPWMTFNPTDSSSGDNGSSTATAWPAVYL